MFLPRCVLLWLQIGSWPWQKKRNFFVAASRHVLYLIGLAASSLHELTESTKCVFLPLLAATCYFMSFLYKSLCTILHRLFFLLLASKLEHDRRDKLSAITPMHWPVGFFTHHLLCAGFFCIRILGLQQHGTLSHYTSTSLHLALGTLHFCIGGTLE